MTHGGKRNRNNSKSLESLLHQQQKELERLKDEMATLREENKSLLSSAVDKVYVEDKCNETKTACDELVQGFRNSQSRENLFFRESIGSLPTSKYVNQIMAEKVDVSTMLEALRERPTHAQLKDLLEPRLEAVQKSVQESQGKLVADTVSILQRKADTEAMEEALESKLDVGKYNELQVNKVERVELDEKLRASRDSLASEILEAIASMQKELVLTLNKKAYKSEVSRMLEAKVDTEDLKSWLAQKADRSELTEELEKKISDVHLVAKLQEKLDRSEFDAYKSISAKPLGPTNTAPKLGKVSSKLEELESKVEEKADLKDICVLLDEKASIQEVNNALLEMKKSMRELEPKGLSDLGKVNDIVHSVHQAVTSELSLGRWIWKTGHVNEDRTIPWNVECINTASDNFVWSKDTAEIVTVIPGLYELHLGIFSDRDPNLQILVNGEPAFINNVTSAQTIAIKPAAIGRKGIIQTKYKSLMRRGKHSAGNVTGWTMSEFIALPSRARTAILYDGGPGVQGFLSLRKL